MQDFHFLKLSSGKSFFIFRDSGREIMLTCPSLTFDLSVHDAFPVCYLSLSSEDGGGLEEEGVV